MARLVPIAVLLVVVVAGCIGGPSDPGATTTASTDETTTTVAPTETTATTTSDATLDPTGDVAPGVTADGVENVSVLLAANDAALQERGYEAVLQRHADGDGPRYDVERRTVAAVDFREFRSDATNAVDGEESTQRVWLNDSTSGMLVRFDGGDGVRYHLSGARVDTPERRANLVRQVAGTVRLADVLQGGEFEVTADGSADDRYVLDARNFSTDGHFGEREVRVVVDGDGVVHRLEASGSLADGGEFSLDYRLERLGVESVEAPDWVADAPDPVDARPRLGFENCTSPYLLLENDGPDALPAGTVATVGLNGTEHPATLDEPLAADAERALYLDAEGEIRVAATDAVPASRTAMPNEADVSVVTGDGLVLTNAGMGFGCESASADGGSSGGSSSGGSSSGSESGNSGSGGSTDG